MAKTFKDLLFPITLFFLLILLVAFNTKTVSDTQIGMAVASSELNETNFYLDTTNILFAVFFNPIGVLIGIIMLVGILIIGAAMVAGLGSKR